MPSFHAVCGLDEHVGCGPKEFCYLGCNWSIAALSFSARIDIVKMSVLPRLSYLFMSLLVKFPTSQFQEWDKQISRFIWNGKKPRIKFSIVYVGRTLDVK